MKIKVYTVGELPDLLDLDFYKNGAHLPIYPLRAVSYFHNPKALKSDKVLWCMVSGAELIAYRLVLPDLLGNQTKKIKAAWLSCIWVNPKHRGKGYGKDLTNLALKEWDNKCLATNFAPASFEMYSSMKFFYPLKIKEGLRLYYRLNMADLLAKRNKLFATIKPILKLGDSIFNFLRPAKSKHELQSLSITIQPLSKMDEETYVFIQQFANKEFGVRSKDSFDWISSYPWMRQIQEPDQYARRYHFSATAQRFEQVWHKVSVEGRLVAVMMSSIINKDLKIPYLYVKKIDIEYVAKYIENFCLEDSIYSLTIFHDDLLEYYKEKTNKALFQRPFRKKIMAFNGIPKELVQEDTTFQDGLGDGVFT